MSRKTQDVRWLQRLSNFRKALARLNDAVGIARERPLSELEKQGVIQSFEYTYELGWKLLQDYLRWQGYDHLTGSRDVTREAFSAGLISEGETWMRMLQDRNLTSHSYNAETANAILANIQSHYHGLLNELETTLLSEAQSLQEAIHA